jgi:hypothetical protein
VGGEIRGKVGGEGGELPEGKGGVSRRKKRERRVKGVGDQ